MDKPFHMAFIFTFMFHTIRYNSSTYCTVKCVCNVCLCVHLQVADDYLAPDVLSTVKEMKVANFRRVPKMPVYGMSQPTSEVLLVD